MSIKHYLNTKIWSSLWKKIVWKITHQPLSCAAVNFLAEFTAHSDGFYCPVLQEPYHSRSLCQFDIQHRLLLANVKNKYLNPHKQTYLKGTIVENDYALKSIQPVLNVK